MLMGVHKQYWLQNGLPLPWMKASNKSNWFSVPHQEKGQTYKWFLKPKSFQSLCWSVQPFDTYNNHLAFVPINSHK